MNNTSETNWAKLDALSESEIDTSDIPPLTEEFFNKSRWWKPVSPLNALVQVDPQTLAWFQSQGDDYEKKWQQHYEFTQKLIKQRSFLLDISKYILLTLAPRKSVQQHLSSPKKMGKRNQLLAFSLTAMLGACASPLVSQTPTPNLNLSSGVQITLQAKINPEQGINEITPQILESTKLVLEKRINGLGISQATVVIGSNNQLFVKLPGVSNSNQANRVIGKTGQLDFRKQKKGTENELRARLQILQAATIQREVLKNSKDKKAIADNEAEYKKSIEVLKGIFESTGLRGNMVKDAVASPMGNNSSNWQIALTFDDQGSDLFTKTTGEIAGTGRALGIFLDEQLVSFPSVGPEFQGKGITGGRAVITGKFTLDSANELALQIRSGSLPIPLEIVDSHSF